MLRLLFLLLLFFCNSLLNPSILFQDNRLWEHSVSIQPTNSSFQRAHHESKSWLFFIQGMLGMKLTISHQGGQGLKPNAQQPLVVEREKPGKPFPSNLTQVSLLISPKMSKTNLAGGWAFVWASDSFPILHEAAALAVSDPSFFGLKACNHTTSHLKGNYKSYTFSNHCFLTLLPFLLQ